MYIPSHFAETDREKLFEFIERHSFGLLISTLEGEPFATHLPLLLDRTAGPNGTLVGHMARANPHWKTTDRKALVILSGPHAYVSPSWYEAENVVPTWNYTAVHVYGTFELVEDHAATVQIVRDYVKFYEASLPKPWTIAEQDEFVDKLAGAVVGFRIPIERIEGKWKLNQNHPRERREKVIRALSAQGDENSLAIAELMRERLE